MTRLRSLRGYCALLIPLGALLTGPTCPRGITMLNGSEGFRVTAPRPAFLPSIAVVSGNGPQGVSQNQMSCGYHALWVHLQSGERPDRDVRADMNHQGWLCGKCLPWRTGSASLPCEAFTMLRWSTGPTVIAHPYGQSRLKREAHGTRRVEHSGALIFRLFLLSVQKQETRSQTMMQIKSTGALGCETDFRCYLR